MKKIALILLVLSTFFLAQNCSKKQPSTGPGQIKPGSAEDLANQGLAALNVGEMSLAEKKLLQSVKKKPTLAIALHGLGVVYLHKRDFDNALKYFKRLITLRPNHYDAHNSIGIIYIEKGEYEKAKENLLIAANAEKYRTPENAFLNLANLEIRRNNNQAAMRYIEKGLAKNKGFAPLYNMKGLILENQKKYNDAIECFEKALALLAEDDVSYLINIGRVYAKAGYKIKALDVLEKAMAKTNVKLIRDQIKALIKSLDK